MTDKTQIVADILSATEKSISEHRIATVFQIMDHLGMSLDSLNIFFNVMKKFELTLDDLNKFAKEKSDETANKTEDDDEDDDDEYENYDDDYEDKASSDRLFDGYVPQIAPSEDPKEWTYYP